MVGFALFIGIANGNAQIWSNNIDKALKEAASENKNILLFFSVPEHCDNCEELEENIFKSAEFNDFANANYILVKIDFSYQSETLTPEAIEKNLLIVEKYNKDGFFPLVVILNKNAKAIGKTGVYKKETPSEFITLLQSFNRA